MPPGPPVLQQSSGNEPKPAEPIVKTTSKGKKKYVFLYFKLKIIETLLLRRVRDNNVWENEAGRQI